jgi:predicted amidohydrolase YtcJ
VRAAIYVADPSDNSDEAVAQLVERSKALDVDPNFLRSDLVKVFADGVMEYPAQTAAMLSPHLDADGKPSKALGELYFDPQRFASLVTKLDAAGITVHIHAIGDRAVRASLDALPPPARRMATRTTATRWRICSLSRASRSSA